MCVNTRLQGKAQADLKNSEDGKQAPVLGPETQP